MNFNHANQAILNSYRELRTRIGILAFAFPIILTVVGHLRSIGIQPALSDYYFAEDPVGSRLDHTPVRLWFCGILFIVGFFLYRYRGFSKNEDRWLSLAGTFALGVAIFPESMKGRNDYDFVLAWTGLTKYLSLHGIFAVMAFACIAVVIVWYADSTLWVLQKSNPAAYHWYKRVYRAIAVFMVASIGISIFLKYWLAILVVETSGIWAFANYWQIASILAAETFGIWSFAAYWFVKNSEISLVAEEMRRGRGETHGPAGSDSIGPP